MGMPRPEYEPIFGIYQLEIYIFRKFHDEQIT
jgi:hypothetical protein